MNRFYGAARAPAAALPRGVARAPQLRSCHPRRSVEEQNFTDSELEEPSDDEETCVGGKCRRAGKRYRAPKPYSNLPWLEREDCCLRRSVRAFARREHTKSRWHTIQLTRPAAPQRRGRQGAGRGRQTSLEGNFQGKEQPDAAAAL